MSINDLKILYWDIETSPMLIAEFSLFNKNAVNPSNIIQDWFVICAAWKWAGDKKISGVSVLDDKEAFKEDHTNDLVVIKKLHEVLSEADLIVGHNSDGFDWKKINTRFLEHGLDPIPRIRSVDTYKIVKKEFKFSSNKLDYVAQKLGVGSKLETEKGLWTKAMFGDPRAIRAMLKYNKQDIVITEKVYLKLRPFYTAHANLSTVRDDSDSKARCPKCNSTKLHKRGYAYTNAGKFSRYKCTGCKGWSRGRQNQASKKITGSVPSSKFLTSQ